MEKNFKRLIIANGVLFAFAILAMIVERATVPDQLAGAISLVNCLYLAHICSVFAIKSISYRQFTDWNYNELMEKI